MISARAATVRQRMAITSGEASEAFLAHMRVHVLADRPGCSLTVTAVEDAGRWWRVCGALTPPSGTTFRQLPGIHPQMIDKESGDVVPEGRHEYQGRGWGAKEIPPRGPVNRRGV